MQMKRAFPLLTLGVALLLGGCASQPPALSAPASGGYSAELYGTIDSAVMAAITALEERRLGDAKVERSDRGATVRGELSGLAGAVVNSHGGNGVVSIEAGYPGGTRLKVSATTRSRLAHEPVGGMDALKGYNYNDPKYAREIVQRIDELLSKGNLASLKAEDERARAAWEAEERRKAEAQARIYANAASGSRVTCTTDADCRKAFQLAQIYVSTKSDMKIQLATDAIIETYNPTETGKMGAKVIKTPGAGQSAEIVLTVSCRDCNDELNKFRLQLMAEFRPFIEARLK